ncbi:MAG: carbohydrate ABC transporter permease [Alphaproteobacteria bacterium]|nr:carbohydrate ABC transporter permease [Alphaproteobacteria bacterium]
MRSFVPSLLRWAAVLLALAWSVGPILLVVTSSFKEARDIFATPPSLVFAPTLDNYRALWAHHPMFFRGLLSSLVVTAGATALTLAVSSLAGYVYARHLGRVLQGTAFVMLALRMLPPIIITIPLFPAVNALGLNDTHGLLILLYAAFYVSIATWIMRAFIAALPRELEEAAEVDGAGLARVLWRIVLPLAAQGMVAAAIFVVVFAWNEFVFALVFTTTSAKTAPVVIAELLGTVEGVQWGVIFAASTIQLAPILALVLLLQRYLVAGLTAGAVKA